MIKNIDLNQDWISKPLDLMQYLKDGKIIENVKMTEIINELNNTSDWRLKVAIIFFLSYSDKKDVKLHIEKYLFDKNEFVRFASIYTLSKLIAENFDSINIETIYDEFDPNRFLFVQNLYTLAGLNCNEINNIRTKLKKCKKFNKIKIDNDQIDILNRYGIKSLWHITHINNLFNILKEGIKCRNQINNFQNIAAFNVLDRRPQWSKEYVPLFFASNTPMLYVVSEQHGCENLVVLEIDPSVLFLDKTIFSDGNIASSETSIYHILSDLENLDWGIIYSDKPAYSKEWKRKRSAEVLVHTNVLPCYIKKIHFFLILNIIDLYKQFWTKLIQVLSNEYDLNLETCFDFYEEGVKGNKVRG